MEHEIELRAQLALLGCVWAFTPLPSTEVMVLHRDRYAHWTLDGVAVDDPAVLERLLADEVDAFVALPW